MTLAPEKRLPLKISPLVDPPRRGAFACGERDIDEYFLDKAHKHHSGLRCRISVAHSAVDDTLVGFYGLSIKLESEQLLDKAFHGKVRAERAQFASVHLDWLAVQKPLQRQGNGTTIMGAALRSFYDVVMVTGIIGMTLVALDAKAVAFYESLGFAKYGPLVLPQKMFLPAQTVVDLVRAAETDENLN